MILAVDEQIPYWSRAFSQIGEIRPFSGRHIRPAVVRDADALIVRSITRVDAALLEGSSVRFVATTSSGMDHLDQKYLRMRGVFYASSYGCNSNAVAEYVTAALLATAGTRGWNLSRMSLAIVGAGRIGSLVEEKARILGMHVLLCDPPLLESTGDSRYMTLDDVIDADVLSFHVPLIKDGPHPTYHMVDGKLLERLSRRQFLLNTSRGEVFDEARLKEALRAGKIEGAATDVWENEPWIDRSFAELIDLGTPHIAGFSLDGKLRGTEIVLEKLCRFFRIPVSWSARDLYPSDAGIEAEKTECTQDAVRSVVLQAYDIGKDDANMRALKSLAPDRAAAGFDRLRNEYQFRPEFRHFLIRIPDNDAALSEILRGLQFQVLGLLQPGNADSRDNGGTGGVRKQALD